MFRPEAISNKLWTLADQFRLPYVFDLRPSVEFNYEASLRKLLDLQLQTNDSPPMDFITPSNEVVYSDRHEENYEAGFTTRQGKLLRLSGLVDFESRLSLGCVGAVLSYLQRRRAVEFLPGDLNADAMFRITTIEMFSLQDMMYNFLEKSVSSR